VYPDLETHTWIQGGFVYRRTTATTFRRRALPKDLTMGWPVRSEDAGWQGGGGLSPGQREVEDARRYPTMRNRTSVV
jgi:hypothetical protein